MLLCMLTMTPVDNVRLGLKDKQDRGSTLYTVTPLRTESATATALLKTVMVLTGNEADLTGLAQFINIEK